MVRLLTISSLRCALTRFLGTLNYVYKQGGDLIITLPLVTPRTNPSIYAWALKLLSVK